MNEIVQYREKPLSIEEFRKLETHAAKYLSVKEKMVSKSVPRVDSNGEIYGWESDLVPCGSEIFFKSEPDEKLMESLQRPSTRQAIAKHLTDLAAHRPYARGQGGFLTVVQDLIHDLNGCSEWAILKTCETFRRQTGQTFFPNTADIIASVKQMDEQLRWAYAARPNSKKLEAGKPEADKPPSTKERRRVSKGMKLLAKQVSGRIMTKWEQRFFDAMAKPKWTPKHTPPSHNFGYGENV